MLLGKWCPHARWWAKSEVHFHLHPFFAFYTRCTVSKCMRERQTGWSIPPNCPQHASNIVHLRAQEISPNSRCCPQLRIFALPAKHKCAWVQHEYVGAQIAHAKCTAIGGRGEFLATCLAFFKLLAEKCADAFLGCLPLCAANFFRKKCRVSSAVCFLWMSYWPICANIYCDPLGPRPARSIVWQDGLQKSR